MWDAPTILAQILPWLGGYVVGIRVRDLFSPTSVISHGEFWLMLLQKKGDYILKRRKKENTLEKKRKNENGAVIWALVSSLLRIVLQEAYKEALPVGLENDVSPNFL